MFNPVFAIVHGNWAVWTEWGDCSASCDGGQRRRFRTCTNPSPRHNGRQCLGMPTDTEACNTEKCAGKHMLCFETINLITYFIEVLCIEQLQCF